MHHTGITRSPIRYLGAPIRYIGAPNPDRVCMIVMGQKPDGTPNYVRPAQNLVGYK